MTYDSSEPNPRCRDDDERLEAYVELVIARGNSTKVLDATEKAFDKVAPFVKMSVEGTRLAPVGPRGDDGLGTAGRNSFDQGIAVVGFVCGDRLGVDARKQGLGGTDVRGLSRCEFPAREVTERFDQGMYLRGQAAARASDGLSTVFFCAPEAC